MIAPQNIQLLDLLLGANAAPGKAKTDASSGDQSATPFVDILGLFVNPKQSTAESILDKTDGAQNAESQSSDMEIDINPLKNNTASVALNSESPQGDVVDSKSKGVTSDLPFMNLPAVDMSKIQQLIESATAETTTGKFDILSANVVDGRLELAVAPLSNEDGTGIVKISLPAEKLLEANSKESAEKIGSDSKTSRVSSQVFSRIPMMLPSQSGDSRLASLFEKLNLKEIDIDVSKSEETGKLGQQSETAKVTLLSGGDKIAIATALLPRKEIRVASQNGNDHGNKADTVVQSELVDGDLEFGLGVKPGNTPGSLVKNTMAQSGRLFDPISLTEQNIQRGFDLTGTLSSSGEAINGFDTLTETKTFSQGKTVYSSVRLTLPQAELSNLQQGGKSVTFRIEPEHLGPARLSLTMNNHTLSARVSVQTIQAKTIIEHSLDQLTDQLNRAGIKVDSIAVNVAGGNAQEQLPDRRPSWHPAPNHRSLNLGNEEDVQQVRTIAPTVTHGRSAYITGDSLNLLA